MSDDLAAPPLLWPEARAAMHQLVWRGDVTRALGESALARLERLPVSIRSPRGLGPEAWRLADAFGWAKTYDAEYVALARILGCRLVTLDVKLRRDTARLGFVIGPDDL